MNKALGGRVFSRRHWFPPLVHVLSLRFVRIYFSVVAHPQFLQGGDMERCMESLKAFGLRSNVDVPSDKPPPALEEPISRAEAHVLNALVQLSM